MNQFNEKYIVNDKGKRIGAVLDILEYQKILEELEELESIRAYDAAKTSKNEVISFEQAINEIDQEHK